MRNEPGIIFPKQAFSHRVVKRNTRLWIERFETGELIYTPPDFLRAAIRDRESLRVACRRLDARHDYADVIREFETSVRPCNDPAR